MGLQERLNTMKEAARGKLSEETREIMNRALEQLEADGLRHKTLGAGGVMPDFTLQDPAGMRFSSAELLQAGPLVVNFYRGSW